MDNTEDFELKETITFDEFKAWMTGFLQGKKGIVPNIIDWALIQRMMNKVTPDKEIVYVPSPYAPITPYVPYNPHPDIYPSPMWPDTTPVWPGTYPIWATSTDNGTGTYAVKLTTTVPTFTDGNDNQVTSSTVICNKNKR